MSKGQEVEEYFNQNTEVWSRLFHSDLYSSALQRTRIVAERIAALTNHQGVGKSDGARVKHLDFGCGSGELLVMSAHQGLDLVGIDVASGMVEAARSMVDKEGMRTDNIFQGDVSSLARLDDSSVDIFSALGLIEYLTLGQLDQFLDEVVRLLSPGGHAFIGSRNRLFNVVSDNVFTKLEEEIGELEKLRAESDFFDTCLRKDQVFEALNDPSLLEPFSEWRYPDTLPVTSPVSVSQRIQYSVCDLSARLLGRGLEIVGLRAVRFHPANMSILDPEAGRLIIDRVNLAIDQDDDTVWAVPWSSSYVLQVRKTVLV